VLASATRDALTARYGLDATDGSANPAATVDGTPRA